MFRFKQFTIHHDRCAMKVGTDGVLLGAWSNVEGARQVLDIGTGTGLIALMIAQRTSAWITGLEIDDDAVSQAGENVENSPWKDRVTVIQEDFRTFNPMVKYDLIVSNPPYFVDSLTCPAEKRTMARHTRSLNYDELIDGVVKVLADKGRFCVVIPMDVSDALKRMATAVNLFPHRQLNVVTSPGKLPKRTLIEFVHNTPAECTTETLLIEEKRHQYSLEYIELTREYYLNM